ncbi:MAG: DUF423 domain-containing protein, partial [Balneolaceae bacterium]
MALAVAFGAFGAHFVRDVLTPERFDIYQTAVQYHFFHSLGLLIVGLAAIHVHDSPWLLWSGRLLIAGIVIFSGSLYLLVATQTGWFGAITPLGGLALIAGWILLGVAVYKR